MRSPRRTPRLLRAAAVVAGAAAVLAVPAGAAFADSATAPAPRPLPVAQPAQPKPGTGGYVTTVRLADGSVAKVYKIGDRHFEADVFSGPTKLDTLVGRGADASYGQSNGLRVVLRPDGRVTSWMAGTPKPAAKRASAVRIAMPDGWTAKLTDGPQGARVEMFLPNGSAVDAVDLKRPTARHDVWTYRIVQDGPRVKFVVIDGSGGGSSWVYGFDGRLVEQYRAGSAA
ncbi:hypothetical protein AB0P12_24400 [Streptomyces subrutilus]|uniref:hypothetical protein n=1 Tax=Streptomyces subrutilus TaxID=36818 RepID=UPI0033D9D2AA